MAIFDQAINYKASVNFSSQSLELILDLNYMINALTKLLTGLPANSKIACYLLPLFIEIANQSKDLHATSNILRKEKKISCLSN